MALGTVASSTVEGVEGGRQASLHACEGWQASVPPGAPSRSPLRLQRAGGEGHGGHGSPYTSTLWLVSHPRIQERVLGTLGPHSLALRDILFSVFSLTCSSYACSVLSAGGGL